MTDILLPYLRVVVLASIGLAGCNAGGNTLCPGQVRSGSAAGAACGGSCEPCDLGDSCRDDGDCLDSRCVKATCAPLACEDGIRDDGETDVDCGGSCGKCSGGRQCVAATDCASGTCLAATRTCASLTTMSFADAVHYPSGDKTYAVLSGDLDGDGHDDLVAANEQASSLSVYLGTGDGSGTLATVASEVTAFLTGAFPTGGAIADVNHDGIPDVITADYHGDSVSVLLGTGAGALAAKVTYPTVAGAETANLAVGDLNGDGNVDVIAANPSTRQDSPPGSVAELLGRTDGTFAPAVIMQVGIAGTTKPYSVAIGDFDGNGTKDVAIADLINGPIIVKLGRGDGTFQPEVTYPAGGTGPYTLITIDVNLDGKLDLVTANRGSSDVSVLLGRGDGTFRKPIVSTTGPLTNPFSIAVADFNLDGVPDVVTANFGSGTASVLLGLGNGRFEPPFSAGPTATSRGQISYGVATGDFNGDGKPDLATANPADNDISVKLSTSH
jgi:hypothetical protein